MVMVELICWRHLPARVLGRKDYARRHQPPDTGSTLPRDAVSKFSADFMFCFVSSPSLGSLKVLLAEQQSLAVGGVVLECDVRRQLCT